MAVGILARELAVGEVFSRPETDPVHPALIPFCA
jgi:hypothetical protein